VVASSNPSLSSQRTEFDATTANVNQISCVPRKGQGRFCFLLHLSNVVAAGVHSWQTTNNPCAFYEHPHGDGKAAIESEVRHAQRQVCSGWQKSDDSCPWQKTQQMKVFPEGLASVSTFLPGTEQWTLQVVRSMKKTHRACFVRGQSGPLLCECTFLIKHNDNATCTLNNSMS
jgi:hypothetical protein